MGGARCFNPSLSPLLVDQSAAAVLELSVFSDGQLGGVARRQAVAEVGGAVTLLHLRQRRHQPRVRRVQGPDPLLLIGDKTGTGQEVRRTTGVKRTGEDLTDRLKPPSTTI